MKQIYHKLFHVSSVKQGFFEKNLRDEKKPEKFKWNMTGNESFRFVFS